MTRSEIERIRTYAWDHEVGIGGVIINKRDLENILTEILTLHARLERYGRHLRDCRSLSDDQLYQKELLPCTCGFQPDTKEEDHG